MQLQTLSVKQPWASLLVAGVKRFEVRTWSPKQVGPILIHASSGKARGIKKLRMESRFQEALQVGELTDEQAWPHSAIVGLVDIVRVIGPDENLPDDVTRLQDYLGGGGDGYLWEVGDHWVFPTPVPSLGKLHLWTPPNELFPALNKQLRLVKAGVQLS